MPITPELRDKITMKYEKNFGIKLSGVEEGTEGIFGGSILIATYPPSELGSEDVRDVVYIDSYGDPMTFSTTEELVLFLRSKARFGWVDKTLDTKLFHAAVLVLLLFGIFIAGLRDTTFNGSALAIMGSVVGLAAGMFFSAAKK